MSDPFVVYSIPGSGTKFVCQVAERLMGCVIDQNPVSFRCDPKPDQFTRWHVNDRPLETTLLVVIPLRHPVMTLLTTASPQIPPTQDMMNFRRYVAQVAGWWRTLQQNTASRDVFYFPVDGSAENHRRLLLSLASYVNGTVNESELEVMLQHWDKVGSRSHSQLEQDQFLQTGTLEGRNIGDLQSAIDWYNILVR